MFWLNMPVELAYQGSFIECTKFGSESCQLGIARIFKAQFGLNKELRNAVKV